MTASMDPVNGSSYRPRPHARHGEAWRHEALRDKVECLHWLNVFARDRWSARLASVAGRMTGLPPQSLDSLMGLDFIAPHMSGMPRESTRSCGAACRPTTRCGRA
jgi:hypothetical protein